MITDAQTRFSDNQAVTTGTQNSTNTLDLLAAATNLGVGADRRVVAQVTTAFAGGTSLKADYVQSASADLSSPDVLVSGPVIVEASLVAGAKLLDVVAPGNTKRYVGIRYTTVGTHTAGAVFAGIVSETDHNTYPPSNTGY